VDAVIHPSATATATVASSIDDKIAEAKVVEEEEEDLSWFPRFHLKFQFKKDENGATAVKFHASTFKLSPPLTFLFIKLTSFFSLHFFC
jgi:hypothetical protein